MTPEDALMSPEGELVPIRSVHIGDYLAGFHHIATSKESPGPGLEGHLLNTNGGVSADYTVQIFARRGAAAGFSAYEHMGRPVVGSPEYVARSGRASLQAPGLPEGFAGPAQLNISRYNTRDLPPGTPVFAPAEATIVRLPPDACSFLPPEEAEARGRAPTATGQIKRGGYRAFLLPRLVGQPDGAPVSSGFRAVRGHVPG